jgi:phosphoribosylamine--glycine ligase
MKILVIGSGAREHGLCFKIFDSAHCEQLYCAPGNAGIAEIASMLAVPRGAGSSRGLGSQ